jgi:hypothetical protein
MQAISKRLVHALASPDAMPIDLVDVVGKCGTAVFLTTSPTRIIWSGNTYIPAVMNRSPIDESLPTTTTISVDDPDPETEELLEKAAEEGAEVILRRTDRRTLLNPRDAETLTAGRLRDLAWSEAGVSFGIMGVVGMLAGQR